MSDTDNDRPVPPLDQAIEHYHQALNAFVTGDPALQKKMFSTREDVSLANPLGPPRRGRAEVEGIMDSAAAVLRDGEPITFERISLCAGTDLAFIVELEWARAKVAGSTEMMPIPLRVTTVFRLEDGQWKVVHRHADTIVAPRPVQSIIQT
ncbi:YybH family protein [Paenarthrobacter sp. NPDC058040]|uniref:YybH family protein n=1 Tax=unclassified Paenarthrobacter TaxID=2634190 RepID=UPI0036D7F8C7